MIDQRHDRGFNFLKTHMQPLKPIKQFREWVLRTGNAHWTVIMTVNIENLKNGRLREAFA